MYTANLGNLLDFFEKDIPTWKTTTTLNQSAVGYTKQNDDSYQIAFNVSGIRKEDVSIDVEGNLLKVKGETKYKEDSILKNLLSSVDHTIRISSNYDISQTSAVVENGILLITIPKIEEAKQKKMDVDFIPEYQKVVSESVNNTTDDSYNSYVEELSKVFGKR
jgi:HSP20 family protein